MKPVTSFPLVGALVFLLAGPASANPILVGIDDDFLDGPDPLSPSPELVTTLAGFGGCQDLDLVAGVGFGVNNRQVAHTFTDLPDGITQAWLEVKVRAGNDAGVHNDGIFLTFVDEGTLYYSDAIAWRGSFGPVAAAPPYYPVDEPGLVGSWSAGDEATIVLDLKALPMPDGTTISITPLLSRNGFLDVNVSDETGADYFRLSYVTGATGAPLAQRSDGAVELRAYPNPCRGAGTLAYTVDRPGSVRLDLFDVTGRRVRSFVETVQGAGAYRIDWAARDETGRSLPPGAYFVRLHTPTGTAHDKVTIIR